MSQISELIRTATQAAVAMDCDRSSVLFSYGDGFDRTAQVNSCHVQKATFVRQYFNSAGIAFA